MNEETRNLPIEPDLEARIVALVLGEASDFETEELDRLIKSRPELAVFKCEMEQMSSLLRNVGQHELEKPDPQWQLPSERRQVVLDAIHGKVSASTIGTGAEVVGKRLGSRRRRWTHVFTAVAAAAILVVLIGLVLPAGQRVPRETAGRFTSAKANDSPLKIPTVPPSSTEPSSSLDLHTTDRQLSYDLAFESNKSGSAEDRSRQNSSAALSEIQKSIQLSVETASSEPGAIELSTPPLSVSELEVTPKTTSSQNGSTTGGVSGYALSQESLSLGEIAQGYFNTTPQSAILPDPDYRSPSEFVPNQTDKFVAGIQPPPPTLEPAAPQVVAPDDGTVLLGGIKLKILDRTSLDFPALGSIDNRKDFAEGELSTLQAGTGRLVSPNEIEPRTANFVGAAEKQPARQSGEVDRAEQQGQGIAENSESTRGRDFFAVPGGMGGGGGVDKVEGKRVDLDVQSIPRFQADIAGGVPIGGDRDIAESETGKPELSTRGSTLRGEFSDLALEKKNETGQVHDAEEAVEWEKKPDDSPEKVLDEKQWADDGKEGRGKGDLEQPSAEDSLKRLSETRRELGSELTRNGQTNQNDDFSVIELGNGISRREVREQSGKSSTTDANRGIEIDAAQGDLSHSPKDGELNSTKNPSYKREAPSAGLSETNAATERFSTFSLHVSDVSFKLAASSLARGEWPEAAKIRIEEFVNAFDYGDPLPCGNEKVACVVEQAIHPFLQQRNVLRVSMRTSAEGRSASTPLRLTLVLDNSGSMERIDRQQAIRQALSLLAQQLSPNDQVTLISFARQPRLLAENVSGTETGRLVDLIGQIPSEGGTNIEAALKLAFEKAASQRTPGVQNRIVLLTDGAVNLGNADPESLSRMVETMRTAGIAFDAAGISADGLNDEILEALTRKGDGRYYLLDGEESSGGRFAQQIAGALRPSASNVKVQVEFNPNRVGQYKLLGFEKHIIQQEDFRNDAVDAAELAAAEAGVALYQFEAKADGDGDVGTVSVRFRDLVTGQMIEQRWPIPYEASAPRPDQASDSIQLATTAAMLAARLRSDALGETVDLKSLANLIAGLSEQQQNDPRVQQLKTMIEQTRLLSQK